MTDNSLLGSSMVSRAPMAFEEEDVDLASSAQNSRLTATPFFVPKLSNNTHLLKPTRDPESEDIPLRPSEKPGNNTGGSPGDTEEIPGGPNHDDGIDSIDGVSGIDDGLLPETPKPHSKAGSDPKYNGEFPSSIPDIPYGFGPTPDMPDVNIYQHKKTVAQGMMDIALLSANANQLRYVLESGGNHPYYYASLSLIGISLLLQVGVGVGLILNSRYNVSYEPSMRKANRINNYTVLAIFLITVMNVFISAFGIASVNTGVATFPSSPRLISDESGSDIDMP